MRANESPIAKLCSYGWQTDSTQLMASIKTRAQDSRFEYTRDVSTGVVPDFAKLFQRKPKSKDSARSWLNATEVQFIYDKKLFPINQWKQNRMTCMLKVKEHLTLCQDCTHCHQCFQCTALPYSALRCTLALQYWFSNGSDSLPIMPI